MRVTQITVSYGETQSLPEYSNIKPSLTLTAQLDESDEPVAIEAALWAQAKQAVQEQIDLALESCGRAAKYDPAPRYQVMRTYHDRYRQNDAPALPAIVVVFPNELSLDKRFVHVGFGESRNLRKEHALRLAAETANEGNEAEVPF